MDTKCTRSSASCKQITSHHRVTHDIQMGWGHLTIRRHINGSHLQIREMFISKTCCQTGHFPFSHPIQEKTLPHYIFTVWASLSWQIRTEWEQVHQSYSRTALSPACSSPTEARWSSVSPVRRLTPPPRQQHSVWPAILTANTAELSHLPQ